MDKIKARFTEIFPELVEFRRDLHMYPELSHTEVHTPEKVANFLTHLGIEVRTGVGGRGVVGTLKGGQPGKTVALRADFDALPIQDEKDVPYRSKVPGVMHACGHDVHTATLLGIAKVLSERKEDIRGTIIFIHQFAEEVIPGGAKAMIEDGCLDGVDAIFGAHVSSFDKLGFIGVKSGDSMANGDTFEINITGSGGHAATPHVTVDPLLVGSQIMMNLQSIVSRNVDPIDSAVVSVTSFNGGDGFNVIPDQATLKGTVRTFKDSIQDMVEEKIENIAKLTAEAAGATADVNYVRGYPALINDEKETNRMEKVAKQLYGEDRVRTIRAQMGMEDFAYYLKEVPGSFVWVGARLDDDNKVFPHHHPMFDVDEEVMKVVGPLLISATFDYLNE